MKQISSRKRVNVYHGYDETIGSDRIIKEFISATGKKSNDYNVLRRLKHPGIPGICDAFDENGAMYLVMEYVEGQDAREYVNKNGVMLESEASAVILGVLEVLDYMHSLKPKPYIHGDIKPKNVLLGEQRVVLIDFGSTEDNSGSSGFCAPECLAGMKKSVASDIYAAGELLHYLVTGRVKRIFEQKNSKGISREMFRIIQKCTCKNPMDRYGCAAGMANDIRRLIKLRESGVAEQNDMVSLCFPGNPETACEIAYVLAISGKKVLTVDLDMLSPAVDKAFGIKKPEYFLQDFIEEGGMNPEKGFYKVGKRLYALPGRIDYEGYEKSPGGIAARLAGFASGRFDVLVFSCNGFPYDGYLMDAMLVADLIIFTVEKGICDIRRFNNLASFVVKRQKVGTERFLFMGSDGLGCSLPAGAVSGVCSGKWLGNINDGKSRAKTYMGGGGYAKSLDRKKTRQYARLLKKAGVV